MGDATDEDPLPEIDSAVTVHRMPAHVRFVGETTFAEGVWVGIELTAAVGRNDGSVRGVRYFSCEQSHGLFVQPVHVNPATPGGEAAEDDADGAQHTQALAAWASMEKTLEAEALQVLLLTPSPRSQLPPPPFLAASMSPLSSSLSLGFH